MTTSTPTPPPGAPRFVAMSTDGSRAVIADSPARDAVALALGAMAQTTAADGKEFTADLWGPVDGSPAEWRYDGRKVFGGTTNSAVTEEIAPALTARDQREFDQRMQTLSAALGRAGITAAATEVASVARPLTAASTRQIAQWLDSARAQ
ncbi:hypothetical protein ACFVS7_35945 [Streptomyces rubiginosohelvolus]|uniref:hypothetical protein n=1 Tax=Streptomyces rubiginosohelvolus TaxID=67362 RepID=UPI0036DB5E6B